MYVVSLYPFWWTVLLGCVIVGSRQLAISILVHDGAHGLLASDRGLNDRAGQWLCAAPLMQNMYGYRKEHLLHHRNTMQADDPDLGLIRPFPATRWALARKFGRDLTGIAGVRRYWLTMKFRYLGASGAWWKRLAVTLWQTRAFFVSQLIIGTMVTMTLGGWYYVLLWWLPNLTWFSFVVRLRNIAEHACVPNTNAFDNTRTTLAGWMTRWLLAPCGVNYHLEHHLFPAVPYYRLALCHRFLKRNGYESQMCITRNYWAMLKQVVAPPQSPTEMPA